MMEKPILFNTEMVRAILDGRKTQTRRLCKITVNGGEKVDHATCASVEYPARNYKGQCAYFLDANGHYKGAAQALIQPGDVLWVRETWNGLKLGQRGKEETIYWYRADEDEERLNPDNKWRPSIHMPRAAARMFLQVKKVRVERLHDIDADGIKAEGLTSAAVHCGDMEIALKEWALLWNSTVKKADLPSYGWCANPWVWVIEFERKE